MLIYKYFDWQRIFHNIITIKIEKRKKERGKFESIDLARFVKFCIKLDNFP